MIFGMDKVIRTFEKVNPFSVELFTNSGELIFIGELYQLWIINYSGYKVGKNVSYNSESKVLTVVIEPFDWLEDEINELKEEIKELREKIERNCNQ